MPVTISGTNGVTFNDSTTQSTAATAPTTAQVLSATAGATAGAVGTYIVARRTVSNQQLAQNSTIAGSSIQAVSVYYGGNQPGTGYLSGSTLSGTWRAMSPVGAWTTQCCNLSGNAGLFLRIS